MDAYSRYIIRTSELRLDELRREAAEYRMSRAAGKRWWNRIGGGLWRRATTAVEPEAPVSLPVPAAADDELRRTA